MLRHLVRLTTLALVIGAVLLPARAGETSQTVRLPVTLGPATSTSRVVVEQGDHLWKISARHLDLTLGREATDAEISPYWVAVIEENRDGLLSGDPDLIYPGEIVTLPVPTLSERR